MERYLSALSFQLSTKKALSLSRRAFPYGWAATYFPTFHRSIIGTAGLNFSVRNGKRCAPASQPPRVSFLVSDGEGKRGHSESEARSRPGGRTGALARASPRAISAARLNVSRRFHLRPIHVVVYHGPLRRPHLGAGFALRCFQRLSDPDAATRRCGWRRNRCTVGPSDPVLSY